MREPRGVRRTWGPGHPLEIHITIGSLRNTGPEPLKITKLPRQHPTLNVESRTCADPVSFVRGGPTLTQVFCLFVFCLFGFFLGGGGLVEGMGRGPKCHLKWAIIGPPAKRHFNGVSLAWR